MGTGETVTFVDNVTEIFSGDTTIIFDSSLVELLVSTSSYTVKETLNPKDDGERYLTIGLVSVEDVGLPPEKPQTLLVGFPTEASWNKT